MGLISRLKRITAAKIDAFLDSLESPELILPQLVKELAARVKQSANAEAKSLTSVKAVQRRLDEAVGRAARMGKSAALAMKAGDEQTARAAIALQIQADKDAAALSKDLAAAETAYNDARQVRQQLQQQLQRIQSQKQALLQRSKAANASKAVLRHKDGTVLSESHELLSQISRFEANVQEAEEEVQTQHEANRILADLPEEKIAQLQRDAEVQKRLEQMKNRMEID